jgi:predicted RNA binding protein YcfA (HicA-like mRNA interferase family)
MPKLGVFSGQEVCSILAAAGFVHVRTRGSHAVMQGMDTDGASHTVPVPLHSEVQKGRSNPSSASLASIRLCS